MPIRKTKAIFERGNLEPLEKTVLSLTKNQTLSTAEIILLASKGYDALKDNNELMDALYDDEKSNYKTLFADGRTMDARYPMLTAIVNLYLKQRIQFQNV